VYELADGTPVRRVRRKSAAKGDYGQDHWDPDAGRWRSRKGDAPDILFRLQELTLAAEAGVTTIWIAEGEKDVLRLEQEGKVATCNIGGAGKWKDEYSEELAALGYRAVVLSRDNDEPGEAHVLDVAASVRRAGLRKVSHRVAALDEKGADVSDHLDAGLPLSKLRRTRPPATPDPEPPDTGAPSSVVSSDVLPAVYALLVNRAGSHAVKTDNGHDVSCTGKRHKNGDRNPSLSIAVGTDKPVVAYCQAGCTLDEIAAGLGVDVAEFSRPLPEDERERKVLEGIEREEIRDEVRRRRSRSGPTFEFPADGMTLREDMAEPRTKRGWTIDRFQTHGDNVLGAAQYKAGKTTLAMNVVAALADGEPFLGQYEVRDLDGRIGFLNYELDADRFRDWFQDRALVNPEKVAAPWHLRGRRLPLWEPETLDRVAAWFRAAEVEYLIVDPAARAMTGLVDNENDNSQIARFTDALDELKEMAGIADLLLLTHTGRQKFEEGEEQSRGATRLEDWMDVGWYLTKDKSGQRALRALGRDVEVEAIDLTYMNESRRLAASGKTRTERRQLDRLLVVVDAVAAAGEGASTKAVENAMTGGNTGRSQAILAAERAGLIERTYADGVAVAAEVRAKNAAKLCRLTPAGEELRSRKVSMTDE
jgi:hypothetical protein